ncbi:MAG: MazG-like family protein [Oscillospiraceae bacterium]
MNLTLAQKRITVNKANKGFDVSDIETEFAGLSEKLKISLDAFHRESVGEVAETLSDVVICALALAEELNIDMENALMHKLQVNENSVYVKPKHGLPKKLGDIHLPNGELLGTPFAKLTLNEYGDLSFKGTLETLRKFNSLYFPYPFTNKDLYEVGLVQFCENGYVIEDLFDVDVAYSEDVFNPNISGKMLFNFFGIDENKVTKEDVEFILLYKLEYDKQGAVEDISYYMTYLDTKDDFINSMLQKGDNI